MSDVITTPPVALASPKSIEYLKALFSERYEGTLDASMYEGATQSEVSARIKRLLDDDGILAPSDESVAKLQALAASAGVTIVAGTTQAKVNRQVRELSRRVSRAAYAKAGAEFDAFLTGLTAQAAAQASDEIPF